MESLVVAAKSSLESVMVTLSNSVTDSERLDPENDTLRALMVALLHAMVDILDPEHEFGEGAPDHEDGT
jgi:hypothetical protein